MRIVIDTNRVIAAMIKDGISRKILFSPSLEFFSPEHFLNEIENHSEEIREKINVDKDSFALIQAFIFERINIMPIDSYISQLEKAKQLITDQSDVPFLALAFALGNLSIWSDDAHFKQQTQIKVFTTSELLKEFP